MWKEWLQWLMGTPGRATERPGMTVEHGEVRGRLLPGGVWEMELDGYVFRAYGKIEPRSNEWMTKAGSRPGRRARELFAEAVEKFRKGLEERSVW